MVTETHLREQWGARLRERRRRKSLTLRQLAQRAGVSHPYLSQVEHGRSGMRDVTRIRVAAALGTTVGELFPWPEGDQLSETEASS